MPKGKAEANLLTYHSSQTESKHAQKVQKILEFHTYAAATSVCLEPEYGGGCSDCTCPTLA